MSEPGRAARTVILDCDPGTDDAIAILLSLASPELEVAAITVAGGNAPLPRTLANASGLVALAGASVPVHAGAARALLAPYPPGWPGHGEDGMAGVPLPSGAPPAQAPAADAICAVLSTASSPVTLVGIAPATNLALALATEPRLAGKIDEIVLMSGARGEGNATPSAEFNAWCDPEALAIVLAARRTLTLATLETGRAALLTAQHLVFFRAAGGRAITTAAAILAALLADRPAGVPLYDPCAIAWLVAPAMFAVRPAAVTVDVAPGLSRGRTSIDHRGPANASLLEPLDPDALFALLAERIAKLP
ncbi:MAG: nucleoside hydrolase [Acetobacteraceae bacterium]